MPALVCMFRGVNLGSARRISMEALRGVFESLRLRDVRTYVQSGNVVFRGADRDVPGLAARIARKFEEAFGFRSEVLLRTAAEMREVIAQNPFEGRGIEPGKLLVWFLEKEPGAEAPGVVQALGIAPEEVRFGARELYIHFPNGQGRSKFAWPKVERAVGTPGTGRNWNTVLKLAEMAGEERATSA